MDKPPVIKEDIQKKRIKTSSLLIVAIVAGVCVYESFVFKKAFTTEDIAWNREGSFYNKIREKELVRLSILSSELEKSNKEKSDIEWRLNTLLSEKNIMEKEKEELIKKFQGAELQAKETLARKEQEVKTNLSMEYEKKYEKEISALKQKVNELEKLKEESWDKGKMEELQKKNKELLDSIVKANRTNESLMKRIEDLQKIRNELEEELRRGKERTSSSW